MTFPLLELRTSQLKRFRHKKKDFDSFIKGDQYQVLFFECTAFFPFAFASHPWFVLNKKGEISRWEVLLENELCGSSWGHLHLNAAEPFKGVGIYPYFNKISWKPRLKGIVEGEVAKEMIEFIERSEKNYPFCYKYSLTGPNSNTYVQMVLNNFPQSGLKLSLRAVGRKFKVT